MKVLCVNPVFLDYRIPFYKRLAELFGHDFHVLYSPNRYRDRAFDSTLNKIKNVLKEIAIPHKLDFVFYTASKSFKFTPNSRQIPIPVGLLLHLIKIGPDIIVSEGFLRWTPWAWLYCVLFRKNLYIYFEGTMHTERTVPKWKIWHRKFIGNFVKGYFANGTETKKYLQSLGCIESQIHIGGMCADIGIAENILKMNQEETRFLRQKYHNDGGITYLYVGRVEHAKGVDLLIEAWKDHHQSFSKDILLLAGDGEFLNEYEKKRNIGVIALGRIPYDEIYKYFAIADVFVIATLHDNWSLVVPEAMTCGLPVAVSIYNGCYTDLVKEGINGFCFDPLKKKEILETLSKFHLCDLKAMGRESIIIEKPFNTENSAQRFYNVIKDGK